MADLLPISERLYDLSILLVFRFDDTYEHDVLLNHHIPVEEDWFYSRFCVMIVSRNRCFLEITLHLELINHV
jgi:hypothetical protein